MKTYQQQMEDVLASLDGRRPKLLLHSCCGPCSSAVIERLAPYFDLTVFYYNPNIHPADEYRKRLETQAQLVRAMGGAVLVAGDYEPQRFFDAVKGLEDEPEGGERCTVCFRLRLEETARRAAEGGFSYFCTTLSVSPHKDAARLNAISEELAARYGVAALPADFKKKEGYKRSLELSKRYGLYRQDDCGCVFSKRENRAG